MKNLRVVFGIIKEHCKHAGVTNETCFSELEKLAIGKQAFLSFYLYIEVLQSLGLISFNNHTKGITITEKGEGADIGIPRHSHVLLLLFLYYLRRLFLFILLCPLFINTQKAGEIY